MTRPHPYKIMPQFSLLLFIFSHHYIYCLTISRLNYYRAEKLSAFKQHNKVSFFKWNCYKRSGISILLDRQSRTSWSDFLFYWVTYRSSFRPSKWGSRWEFISINLIVGKITVLILSHEMSHQILQSILTDILYQHMKWLTLAWAGTTSIMYSMIAVGYHLLMYVAIVGEFLIH